jgi:hypothetical protein
MERSQTSIHVAAALAAALVLGCNAVPDERAPLPANVQPGNSAAGDGAQAGSGGVAGGAGLPPSGGSTGGSLAGGPGGNGSGAAGDGGGGRAGTSRSEPGFMNLAPAMLAKLAESDAVALTPPAPDGWSWFPIDGAICRDGSPTGIFVRFTDADKLFIYVEGGGACNTRGFCHFNPANKDSAILGSGETVIGSALAAGPARQQPGVFEPAGIPAGMFDFANPANPYRDWNGVYIPYCTGDVHFGTRRDATVPNVPEKQQFVGHFNMQKFIGHLVPTFRDRVTRVMLHGTSAGSFGAALNFSMIQDAFGDIPVDAILDSGLPFSDQFMAPCMQARWRELWGLNDALPADCTGCFEQDGGGLLGLADYLIAKHPHAKLGMITSMGDEIMRLFFSAGLNDCANIDTIDPFEVTLAQLLDPAIIMSVESYTAAVTSLRERYAGTGQLSTYYISGIYETLHQHVWRPRFYEAVSGGKTIAQFVADTIDGVVQQVGP